MSIILSIYLMYSIATWRMSIFLSFSHLPLVGPGWGIFSLSLSKLVLISPCLCLSLALASFLLYLDMPALLNLGLGPRFLGPAVRASASIFLFCLSLYFLMSVSDVSMTISKWLIVRGVRMFTAWESELYWQFYHFLNSSTRPPPVNLNNQPQTRHQTWEYVGGTKTCASTALNPQILSHHPLQSPARTLHSARTTLCARALCSDDLMPGQRTFKHGIRTLMIDFHCLVKLSEITTINSEMIFQLLMSPELLYFLIFMCITNGVF